jgi:hypothetical protein
MAYLELSPAIAALRVRPEEFEFSNDTLHHLGSRHRFRFLSEDSVEIHADCGCAILKASKEQALHTPQSRACGAALSELLSANSERRPLRQLGGASGPVTDPAGNPLAKSFELSNSGQTRSTPLPSLRGGEPRVN